MVICIDWYPSIIWHSRGSMEVMAYIWDDLTWSNMILKWKKHSTSISTCTPTPIAISCWLFLCILLLFWEYEKGLKTTEQLVTSPQRPLLVADIFARKPMGKRKNKCAYMYIYIFIYLFIYIYCIFIWICGYMSRSNTKASTKCWNFHCHVWIPEDQWFFEVAIRLIDI